MLSHANGFAAGRAVLYFGYGLGTTSGRIEVWMRGHLGQEGR